MESCFTAKKLKKKKRERKEKERKEGKKETMRNASPISVLWNTRASKSHEIRVCLYT